MNTASKILQRPSPFYRARAANTEIDTIVVHSMYALNATDPIAIEPCIATLEAAEVSAHYAIDRYGQIASIVAERWRARHAGVSKMPFSDDERQSINDFSIGIELINVPGTEFSSEQYGALTEIIISILTRHPITKIVGHDHIAPGRKTDPGALFDWSLLRQKLDPCGKQLHFFGLDK